MSPSATTTTPLPPSVKTTTHEIPAWVKPDLTRLLRVEPLDDSLESVFEYLAQG